MTFKSVGKDNVGKPLIVSVSLLLVFSLFLVYNASSTYAFNHFNGNSYHFLINQFLWVLIGLFTFLGVQIVPKKLILKSVTFLYVVTLILLIIQLINSPFSIEVYGARRWLILNPQPFPSLPLVGRISFQPSELMKLMVCLMIPNIYLSLVNKDTWKSFVKSVLYFLVPAVLVLLQPDLKDALIIVAIGFCIIFVGGVPFKYFYYIIPIGLVILLFTVLFSSYRLERVKTYLGLNESSGENNYHTRQLNIALGSGGVFGVGLGKSRQKNEYLPEVVGDSIFAILGEELGFIGSVSLIGLITFVFMCLYKLVWFLSSSYEQLYVAGVLGWFGVQAFLNMGSISGIIPLTGVPLPLVSYGGSSLLFMLTAIAISYKFAREQK